MSTPPSNDESHAHCSEAESPASTSSLPMDLEKDGFLRSEFSSTARTDSEISTDDERTPISSNDEQQEQREDEISQDQEEEDFDMRQSDRDVEAGSYTISIASVAGGDKVCNVNPPRFSLVVAFAFVLGTFLLVFWLTENDA